MLTVTELVQLLMAFTGSMGFAILFCFISAERVYSRHPWEKRWRGWFIWRSSTQGRDI